LLRLYGGELFAGLIKISEAYLAKALSIRTTDLIAQLKHLHDIQVLQYEPAKDKPQLTFVLPRQDADHLPVDRARMEARRQLVIGKMKAMVQYVTTQHRCRMLLIQDYFNEDADRDCGICDVCIEKRKKENTRDFDALRQEILTVLQRENMTVELLEERIAPRDRELFVDVVRDMVDDGELGYDKTWRLYRVAKHQS